MILSVKRAVLLSLFAVGCAPHPSPLRTTDFSGVSKLAFSQTAGSPVAIAAIEEELLRELPSLQRFELVSDVDAADATVDLSVERWWMDERDTLGAGPQASMPPMIRRVETMEATFRLSAESGEVSERYVRTASGGPHHPDETLFSDDLMAANAVQVVAAFLSDLRAGATFTPSRPAPAQTAPPGETAAPL